MFVSMCNTLKKDGFLILGYVEESGLIQRLLHRAIINKLEYSSFEELKIQCMQLFGEHIKRSEKFGGRSKDSVINDYLINPLYNGLKITEINNWAKSNNLLFYSSYPNIVPSYLVDPIYLNNFNIFQEEYELIHSLFRLRWLYAQSEDNDVFYKYLRGTKKLSKQINEYIDQIYNELQYKKVNFEKLNNVSLKGNILFENIKKFIRKTSEMLANDISNNINAMIDLSFELKNNNTNKKFNKLFNGYNGLGTSYAIWKKK